MGVATGTEVLLLEDTATAELNLSKFAKPVLTLFVVFDEDEANGSVAKSLRKSMDAILPEDNVFGGGKDADCITGLVIAD